MNDPIKRLAEILGREIGLYAEILELKTGEREALLHFSTRGLEEFNAKQNELADRAIELELERTRLVREMAKRRGVGGTPTLREVAGWMTGERRVLLLELGEELATLCERISIQQAANVELINRSGDYLRRLVESLVKRSQHGSAAYTQLGARSSGRETNPSLIDRTL